MLSSPAFQTKQYSAEPSFISTVFFRRKAHQLILFVKIRTTCQHGFWKTSWTPKPLVGIKGFLTQPQSRQSTQVSPGHRGEWAHVLYPGEVEDEGNTGDEDEVEEAHGGKKMSYFSKVGAAKEHLEQHLDSE